MKFIIERKTVEQMAALLASDNSLSIGTMADCAVCLDFRDPDVEHHLRTAALALSKLYRCGYEHKELEDGWIGIRLQTTANRVYSVVKQKGSN